MSVTIYFVDHSVSTEFAKREIQENEELFFHDLATAYQQGYCYLCGDLESLDCLGGLLSGIAGDIFKSVLSRYAESGAAMIAVQKVFVLTYQKDLEDVSHLPDVLQDKEKCRPIHIPTAVGEKWRLNTECCLLTENLDDGDFYLFIAKHYCKEREIPQRRICFHQENGGGNTTYQVLEKCVLKEKKPTLCLVDSDRKYDAIKKRLNEGDTSKRAKTVSENLKKRDDVPPYNFVELPVHEAENLIPFQLLKKLGEKKNSNMGAGLARIAQLQGINDGKPLLYYDFKNGFPYIEDKHQREYWKEVLLKLGGNEESMPFTSKKEYSENKGNGTREPFFPSLNSRVLQDVLEELKEMEREGWLFKQPLTIDEYLKPFWDRIGLQMLTWGYVNEPLRA